MSYKRLRNAICTANVNGGAVLDFTKQVVCVAAVPIKQLHVSYKSGNESLRLDQLLEQLDAVGKVEVFEYRGRGSQETPRIVADVRFDDETYQLVYHLSGPEKAS